MERRMVIWVSVLAGLFALIIGTLQYLKLRAFGYNGLDLGIYSQVLWSLSHGHGFASSIHDPSYLGDHVELWLVPLSWIYRVWPSPLTALWTQTLLLASTVFPLALIARRLLGTKAALLVSVLFIIHPFLYNAAMYEFHGLAFALPLIAWSIYAYVSRRATWWVLSLVAMVLVREDMPLLVAGWAALAVIERRGWRWWIWPLIISVGWFFFAQHLIQTHAFIGQYKYLAFYRWLGDTPRAMVTFPFHHPLLFLAHVFAIQNWLTTAVFLVAFGFLPLLARRQLIPLVFIYAQLLLLGADASSVIRLHYVIPYLPFLAWAALVGWQKIKGRQVFQQMDHSLLTTFVLIVAIIGPVYTTLLYGPAEWPWTPRPDTGLTAAPILQSFLKDIRPTDRVITTFNYLPAVANRTGLYSLNYLYLGRRQYSELTYTVPTPVDVALIDWQQFYYYQFLYTDTTFQGLTGPQRVEQFLDQQQLHLVRWVDNVALYRRDGTNTYQPTTKDIVATSRPQKKLALLSADFGPKKNLAVGPGYTQVEVALRWWVKESLAPTSIQFTLQDRGRTLWSDTRILGQGVRPANEWTPNQAWTTTYRLAIPSGRTGILHLQVVNLTGHLRLNRLRTFTLVIDSREVVLAASLGQI